MNKFEKFDYESLPIDKPFIERRIVSTCGSLFWKFFVEQVHKRGLSLQGLRIVEVGCGTGTSSLVAAMLGAEVTLIDIDNAALRVAKEAFTLYNLKAEYLNADVLKEPARELAGKFDYAFSGGLVEHFEGEDRTKVMAFHRKFLKENGFAMMGAPNQLSAPYQVMRLLSQLLGEWTLEREIPFTFWEFLARGKKAGFKECAVFGTAGLARDILVYGFAVIALLMKPVPSGIKNKLKKGGLRAKIKNIELNAEITESNIVDFVKKRYNTVIQAMNNNKTGKTPKDYLSSGLFFYGVN